uniref:Uncharacterized protein n=1 Tax=Triticum urartu TaxID=4572 RepID=A0A8R7QFB9_TRIUA
MPPCEIFIILWLVVRAKLHERHRTIHHIQHMNGKWMNQSAALSWRRRRRRHKRPVFVHHIGQTHRFWNLQVIHLRNTGWIAHPSSDINLPAILLRQNLHQLALKLVDELTQRLPLPATRWQSLYSQLAEELELTTRCLGAPMPALERNRRTRTPDPAGLTEDPVAILRRRKTDEKICWVRHLHPDEPPLDPAHRAHKCLNILPFLQARINYLTSIVLVTTSWLSFGPC